VRFKPSMSWRVEELLSTLPVAPWGGGFDAMGADTTVNITAGTTDREFVLTSGTVNMSGGGVGENSAVFGSGEFNLHGGAIGSGFRLYDGVMNVRGGAIGSGFRLGTPSGAGDDGELNLFVKSAQLDGVEIPLAPNTTTTVLDRGGKFLTVTLLDDNFLGLQLNETIVGGEDRIRAASLLTLTRPTADGDFDGVVGSDDLNLVLFNWGKALADLPSEWIASLPASSVGADSLNLVLFNWGGAVPTVATVPEPSGGVMLVACCAMLALTGRCGRRPSRTNCPEPTDPANGAKNQAAWNPNGSKIPRRIGGSADSASNRLCVQPALQLSALRPTGSATIGSATIGSGRRPLGSASPRL